MSTTVNPLLQARIETVMRDHAAKRDRAFGGRDVFVVDDAVIDRAEAARRGLIAPPISGGGLIYGVDERAAPPSHAAQRAPGFTLGVCGVCAVVFGALILALYIWAQRGSLWQ